MAGLPATAAIVDARMGYLAVSLRNVLRDIQSAKRWMDDYTVEQLQALGLSAEAAALHKAAATDMDRLARVAQGQEVQPAPTDFLFNARHLWALD